MNAFVITVALVIVEVSTKRIQHKKNSLTCESSTLDQYRCVWDSLLLSKNSTYEIKSTSSDYIGKEYSPVNSQPQQEGSMMIYNFDADNGGAFTKQDIAMYTITKSGQILASNIVTFTPYTQAIPKTVTNVTTNTTETSITVMWKRPYDLQHSSRALWYRIRHWNQLVDETEESIEPNLKITGLKPVTGYNISIKCRFKLDFLDEHAKWSEEIVILVNTSGNATNTQQPGTKSGPAIYWIVISLICGMIMVTVPTVLLLKIKDHCSVLDLNHCSSVLPNLLKWKDLKYTPAEMEKEFYTELRTPTKSSIFNSKPISVDCTDSSKPSFTGDRIKLSKFATNHQSDCTIENYTFSSAKDQEVYEQISPQDHSTEASNSILVLAGENWDSDERKSINLKYYYVKLAETNHTNDATVNNSELDWKDKVESNKYNKFIEKTPSAEQECAYISM